MPEPASQARHAELGAALQEVREEIDRQARAAGRSGDDVTLVVVTKTWPASDVRILLELGVRDFGENRLQEAEEKVAELADLDCRWHFIGQIQSKKAARVAGFADLVHSVDSVRLAQRLDSGAVRGSRLVDCLVQVNLDEFGADGGSDGSAAGEAERRAPLGPRGGAPSDLVAAVAQSIQEAEGLRLRGVMGVAPSDVDPAPAYAELLRVSALIRAQDPAATIVSAGMSGDFGSAIRAGATHVRVGSAILGRRPPLG